MSSIGDWTPAQLERSLRDYIGRNPPRQNPSLKVVDLAVGGNLTVEKPATFKDTALHIVGTIGEPAFVAGWSHFGGGYHRVGFSKTADGWVRLFGTAKSTNNPQPVGNIFVLPPGFRPAAAILAGGAYVSGSAGFIQVQADGTVQFEGPAGVAAPSVTLDCYQFPLA